MDKVGNAGMKLTRGRGEIVPRDFAAAVKDIKLAILQSRARAARASNVEALKLYFYVGGYVSKKTRTAKWGSGAIDALSNRLQVELPGLRGFGASSIKDMRHFFEEWTEAFEIRHLPSGEIVIRQSSSDELESNDLTAFVSLGFTHHREILRHCNDLDERWYYIRSCAQGHWTVTVKLKMGKFRPSYLGQLEFYLSALDELMRKPEENPSIGLLLCEKMNKGVVEFAVRDKSKPLGIATYKTLKSIPKPYRSLAPVIEGVRRELANGLKERSKKKVSRHA